MWWNVQYLIKKEYRDALRCMLFLCFCHTACHKPERYSHFRGWFQWLSNYSLDGVFRWGSLLLEWLNMFEWRSFYSGVVQQEMARLARYGHGHCFRLFVLQCFTGFWVFTWFTAASIVLCILSLAFAKGILGEGVIIRNLVIVWLVGAAVTDTVITIVLVANLVCCPFRDLHNCLTIVA